ncbi:rluD [Symbiodinium sp. CCMP2592]|nr:rluD [Symbiodinium sp. CCMP2592]
MYNAAIETCGAVWIEAVRLCSDMEQRGLLPDIVSFNTLSKHLSRQAAWQAALTSLGILQFRTHRPDAVSYSNAMSSLSSQDWNRAADLFSTMSSSLPSRPGRMSLGSLFGVLRSNTEWERALSFSELCMSPDTSMLNTIASMAIAAVASQVTHAWLASLRMLVEMPCRQLQGDLLSRSLIVQLSQLSQLSQSGRGWRLALAQVSAPLPIRSISRSLPWPHAWALLSNLQQAVAEPDALGPSGCPPNAKSTSDSLDFSSLWQSAGASLRLRQSAFDEPESPVPAALSWERALQKLTEAPPRTLAGRAAALTVALRGLARRARSRACFELLEDFVDAVDPCTYLWCLATLARLSPAFRDPEVLQSVHREVCRAIAREDLSCHELVVVAWSFCMLGLRSESGTAGRRLVKAPEAFEDRDLMLLAWVLGATASSVKELQAAQEEMCRRLELLELHPLTLRRMPIKTLRGLLRDALGALWSFSRCSLSSSRFREVLQRKLRGLGGLLDGSPSEPSCVTPPSPRSRHKGAAFAGLQRFGPGRGWYQDAGGPRIKADLAECWVVFKPCGWEVHNRNVEKQVASCLQIHGKAGPITFDSSHDFGFLHRLDVPSSGLLLAAKSYEAFYNFKFQLAAGMIGREYTALCHGIVPRSREIRAGIFWDSSGPTRSGGAGKPSCTFLAVTKHFLEGPVTFSLLVLSIDSGRRHQIRSDGKYASAWTCREDAGLCSRHFLHRSQLSFRRAVETSARAEPLPQELRACLRGLEEWRKRPESGGEKSAIRFPFKAPQDFSSGPSPRGPLLALGRDVSDLSAVSRLKRGMA